MPPNKKPSKVDAPKIKSKYSGVNRAVMDGLLGEATANKANGALNTFGQIKKPYAQLPEIAGQGAEKNLKFLNQDPQIELETCRFLN